MYRRGIIVALFVMATAVVVASTIAETKGVHMSKNVDDEKFKYGMDVDAYYERAFTILKERYHWATRSLMDKRRTYAIEKEKGRYVFVEYYLEDPKRLRRPIPKKFLKPSREVLDDCYQSADKFVEYIVWLNEDGILEANKVVETHEMKFDHRSCAGGWNLERYEFSRRKTGDYSVYVQAGDRCAGSGRTFFIPPVFFESASYDVFLDKYMKLVPEGPFGLSREDLLADRALKKFLGFGRQKNEKVK